MQLPDGRRIDQRQLRQMLIAMYIQEMRQRQQGGQGNQGARGGQGPSNLDRTINLINQGRQYYNLGRSAYNLFSGPSTTGASTGGASSPGGFSSVEQMLGNGYYTPSTPSGGMSTSGSSTSAPTTTGESSFSWGDAVPYVNSAISAYNAYKLLQNKNMDKDQRNLMLAGTAAQASTPWTGGYGAAAAGAFNTGAALMGDGTEEEKAQRAAHQASMAVANYYTAGLAGLADGFARKQWSGTMKKFDKWAYNNPAGPMYGLNLLTRLTDTDAWKKEGRRVKALLESGVEVPEFAQYRMNQKRGLSKKELVNPNYANDFQGMTEYGYVNNKFENSRNEADMTYETLVPYAAWAEKRKDWWQLSDNQRRAITDAAQKAGAIREHHGTLDVDWDKVGDIDQLIKQAPGQAPVIRRPGRGQVARVSAGMYMDDKGRVQRALTSNQAMRQSYGNNRIPRKGKR